MFPTFQQHFRPTNQVARNTSATAILIPEAFGPVPDAIEFLTQYDATTFNHGSYRVIASEKRTKFGSLINRAFPDCAGRIWPFAYDWLGRVFVLDSERRIDGAPLIFMMEPGSGEVLEIPTDFKTFHEELLIEDPDAALAVVAFSEWRATHPLDLRLDQCVGYITPLFLGGEDLPENFDLSDLAVYWSFCGQLLDKVRGLPDGTPIGTIDLLH